MVREARRASADIAAIDDLPADEHVLVAGNDAADGHTASCHELAERPDVAIPVRVCADATTHGSPLGTPAPYESGAGNHDGLDLPESGLVATESIANLTTSGTGRSGIHLCVDGLPLPSTPGGQQTLHRYLYTVTRAVDRFGGGCHVHLPAGAEDAALDVFAPLFDSVLELRDDEFRLGTWDAAPGAWRAVSGRPGE